MEVTAEIYGECENDVILRAAKAALESENVKYDCSFEVIVASPDEIQKINLENRQIDRVTDVLSFPMFNSKEDLEPDANGVTFLGSMVICKERAVLQAKEYGHSLEREVAFLTVHSILHLLGYDHELGEALEKEMFSKQEQVLTDMGITR